MRVEREPSIPVHSLPLVKINTTRSQPSPLNMKFHPSALWPPTLFLLILLPCAGILTGCKHGASMYQVSGKVSYKDGSVPKARVRLVRFEPTKESTATIRKAATGAIDPKDGSFTLFTRVPGDGVHPGEYIVAFTLCKSAVDTKPLILEKYAYANQSPYKIMVDGDKSDLQYEIEPLAVRVQQAQPRGEMKRQARQARYAICIAPFQGSDIIYDHKPQGFALGCHGAASRLKMNPILNDVQSESAGLVGIHPNAGLAVCGGGVWLRSR